MHTQIRSHNHFYHGTQPPQSACPSGFYCDQSRSWVSPFTKERYHMPHAQSLRACPDVQLQSGDVLIQDNTGGSLVMPNDDTVTIDGNGDFTLDLHPSRHQEHHIHIVRKGDMTIVTFGTDDRRVFFHPNVPYVFRFEGTCVSHDMGLMSVSYDNDDQVSFDVHGIRSISRPQSFHHGSRQQEL